MEQLLEFNILVCAFFLSGKSKLIKQIMRIGENRKSPSSNDSRLAISSAAAAELVTSTSE